MSSTEPAQRHAPLDVSARLELLETVGCGIWVYDGARILYVNRALEEITGYSREDLLSESFFERLIVEGDREMIVARGRARVRGEYVPDHYDIRIIDASGGIRWLSIHARAMTLDHASVSVVSATDTTPLREAERTIQEGASQVAAFLNSVPAHVIATDELGKPTFVNRHWLEFTGQTEAEALADGTAPLIHPDDRKRATKAWAAARAQEKPYEIEYRVRDRNGNFRWQLFRIRPVKSGDRLTGWTSASIDVDETRQLRQELEATVEQLADAITAKDEVLGLISHELRTPLTTLMGNASFLVRHGAGLDLSSRQAIAEDLSADSVRLYAVIENMLLLSRIGAGNLELEREPARLSRLAGEVIADFSERVRGRPIRLESATEPPLANVNPGYYKQVLGNLISNADKYSPPSRPILVVLEVDGNVVVTRVLDEGPGIAGEEVESVFEPFFRSAGHVAVHGIGLGLTVCQRLVELQGGSISVANREGGGACFAFTSPVMDVSVVED